MTALSRSSLLIWYARCPTLTALGLIANRGVLQREFLRENVATVSVRENSTPAVRQGHLDHTLSNLIREADAATALWAYGQNRRSRLLALGATYHDVIIVALERSPLRELRDLVGRRLSVPREAGPFSPAGVRSLRGWLAVLAFAGITPKDVDITPVAAGHPNAPFGDIARREIESLLNQTSEAALFFGAKGAELARSAGLRIVHRFSAREIFEEPSLEGLIEQRALTVDANLLAAHPEAVARIEARLNEAAEFAERFPREALRHAAYECQSEVDDVQATHGELLAQSARLNLDAASLKRLKGLQQWLAARDKLAEDLDLSQWSDRTGGLYAHDIVATPSVETNQVATFPIRSV